MRREVVLALKHLGDPEYQTRVWLNRIYPSANYYDDLSLALHTLYDDTALASNTPLELGATLVNTGEVSAVEAVIRALEAVFAQTGGADVPDEKLLSSEQWPRVVEAAAAAWRTMTGAA